jgi:hypothetical protein
MKQWEMQKGSESESLAGSPLPSARRTDRQQLREPYRRSIVEFQERREKVLPLVFRAVLVTQRLPHSALINTRNNSMGLGKGALLWMVGIPLPIVILLVIFWR